METISSIASQASTAIWGSNNTNTNTNTSAQSGTEPIAGERGSGTTSDPYDHGNQDENPSATTHQSTTNTTSSTSNTLSSGANTSSENRTGPSEATSSDVAGEPSSTPAVKQQGADRPQEEPSSNKNPKVPHTDEEREKMMETGGEFPRDPNDHSGEPLKMHDGHEYDKSEKSEKKDRSQSVSQEGGNPHGKTMGTGEQYVKSTGMPAEGGDFDASNPGAGQEATRLMEEKGIKSEGTRLPPDGPPTAQDDTPETETAKVSRLAKLKEKLHIKK